MCRMFMTVISSIILATMVKINYKLGLVAEIYILQLHYCLTKKIVIYVILQKFKLISECNFKTLLLILQ